MSDDVRVVERNIDYDQLPEHTAERVKKLFEARRMVSRITRTAGASAACKERIIEVQRSLLVEDGWPDGHRHDKPYSEGVECYDCGGVYDVATESPEDHEPDCPIRIAYVENGRWDEPAEAEP